MTFQIVLQRDGLILFYYKDLSGVVDAATVGIQNAAKTKGLTVAYNQPYLKNNLAVRITDQITWLSVAPQSGSLTPGASTSLNVLLNAQYSESGTYNGTLEIAAASSPDLTVEVPVSMEVHPAPQVNLIAPGQNSEFFTSDVITLQVEASAQGAAVQKVEYFAGDQKLGETTTAPYQFQWLGAPSGQYAVSARATDSLGSARSSPRVTLTMWTDNDHDRMPDEWEVENGLDPTVNDANFDSDGDGLTNVQEYNMGTKPRLTDSDDDGVSDGEDAFPTDPMRTMLPPKYALIDLGAGEPVAVSDSGLVVGNDWSYADLAFFWQAGTRTRLGTPPGLLYTRAMDVNDQGKVVGNLTDPDAYGAALGFVWDAVAAGANGNPWTVLTPSNHSRTNPNSSVAFAINNPGVVVGGITQTNDNGTATMWINGASSNLGWGDRSTAVAINSHRDIAGVLDGTGHGTLNGIDLGPGYIRDVNDNRDILWMDGLTLADGQHFSEPSSECFSLYSCAEQVNNAGEVVIQFNAAPFWKKHPKARKYESFAITDLVDPAALEELGLSQQNGLYLTAINNNSMIAGYGYDSDGYEEAFLLLPVDLKKVWSDQLPSVEANFLPYVIPNNPSSGLGTGRVDKPYIIMGAAQSSNFDGKAHIKAQVTVGGSPELRNKILWRLAKKNGITYTPENGTSTYDASGEMVTITLDNPGDGTHESDHHHLVVGYDQDGNGQLSSTEVSVVPKYKWKGKDNDYEFKVISVSHYNSAKQQLNETSGRWQSLFPQARNCLFAFLNESAPEGAASEASTVDRLEYGLDHPVGVLFNANQSSTAWGPPLNNIPIAHAGPGVSSKAVFNATSLLAQDVAESTTINNWLQDKLDAKSQEVRDYFTLHPDENFAEFSWDFDTKDAQGSEQGLGFSRDPDLYLAIGKGTTTMNVQVSVNRGYQVGEIRITGDVLDLFDFDYDTELIMGWAPEELQLAADVQSGYNTLGAAGRVYKSRVEIRNHAVPEFIYQFP